MWRLAFSLSAALVVQAIQLEDGVHDHHNQALVLEGVDAGSHLEVVSKICMHWQSQIHFLNDVGIIIAHVW